MSLTLEACGYVLIIGTYYHLLKDVGNQCQALLSPMATYEINPSATCMSYVVFL